MSALLLWTAAATSHPLTGLSYLGGSGRDLAKAVTTDAGGNIYIVSATSSYNFKGLAAGALPPFLFKGSHHCVLTKLSPDGSRILSTAVLPIPGSDSNIYYEESGTQGALKPDGDCNPTDIAIDAMGNVIVVGATSVIHIHGDGNHTSAYLQGAMFGFVTKLDASLANVVYSIALGGYGTSADDGRNYVQAGEKSQTLVNAVALNAAGTAYVVGWTDSLKYPVTTGSWWNARQGAVSGFATAIATDGSVTASTFIKLRPIGPAEWRSKTVTRVNDVILDSTGHLVVAGSSDSKFLDVTDDAFQSTNEDSTSGFVMKLSSDLKSRVYGTFVYADLNPDCLATAHDLINFGKYVGYTDATSLAADAAGNVYVAGTTRSPCLPTTWNAVRRQMLGDIGGWIMRLDRTSFVNYLSYVDVGEDSVLTSMRVLVDNNTIAAGAPSVVYLAQNATNALPATWPRFSAPAGQIKDIKQTNLFIVRLEIAWNTGSSNVAFATGFGASWPAILHGAHLSADGRKLVVAGTSLAGDLPTTAGSLATRRKGKDEGFLALFGTP